MLIKKYLASSKTILYFSLTIFLLCGLVYPLAMTALSQVFFPNEANGSLIYIKDVAIGSELIGQDFSRTYFMKARPSAVNYNTYSKHDKADGKYTGVRTGSDNFAASNPKLVDRIQADLDAFILANPSANKADIPADLLTASGSGLDPHISVSAAEIQIPALAEHSNISEDRLRQIVAENTQTKFLNVFGEETVNVLLVNIQIAKDLNIISE